jgi:hypothetical protein
MDICEDLDATVTPIKEKDVGIPRAVLKTKEVSDLHNVFSKALFRLTAVAGEL